VPKQSFPFVDRERELRFLTESFSRSSSELLLLYGRRRVGKTTLLQRFAETARLPVLYHVSVQTTAKHELARLSGRLATFFDDDVVRQHPFVEWEALFAYVAQRARERPFGLVLDEFPYAVEGCTALPSILQASWDGVLSNLPIKLVLCGSSLGMMERIFMTATAPLYGRRTGQWRVEPLAPSYIGHLVGARTWAEALQVYGIIGGCPHHALLFARGLDAASERGIQDAIGRTIPERGTPLYDEVPFLLRSEVSTPRVYQSILSAVALGSTKFSELSSKTGLGREHLSRYLGTLVDLGFVRREIPVTVDKPAKSRKGRYVIADPFIAFWYRFVFAHRDDLEAGRADEILSGIVASRLDEHVAGTVEPALGTLFEGPFRDRVPFEPGRRGRPWSSREEFDWVVLDVAGREALVVELKWSRNPVRASALLADLERRATTCRELAGRRLHHSIVARNGFVDEPGLADLLPSLIDLSLPLPSTGTSAT